ncbi:MAG: LCP family protein [Firmicutes bacterium]|nr:LCP family protein [Bacillota bacterium]
MSRVERKQAAAEATKTSVVGNKWGQFKNWFSKQAKWKKGLMIAGATIITLLLVLVIVAYSLFNSLLGDIFTESPEDYDLSLTAVDGYYNILLLGVDSRDMDNLSGTRSDAIMVLSINEETNDVKILSVYRDTYLKIADRDRYDKVNHACMFGGPELVMKTLNESLDLNISNYVVVNFKAVADLVDAVGGIEVEVKDYEIKELNKYTRYTANNIGREEYQLVESAGVQTLDGCQAVSYSRIRKGVGDDFQRTERMRTVVSATMDKMKGMSFGELKKLVKVVTPQVQTNLSKGNVLGLGIRLPQYNINGTEGWPFNVTTGLLKGVSYVFPADLYNNVVEVHKEFFGQEDYVPSDNILTMSNTIKNNIAAGKPQDVTPEELEDEYLENDDVIVDDDTVSDDESNVNDESTSNDDSSTSDDSNVDSDVDADVDTDVDSTVNPETNDSSDVTTTPETSPETDTTEE